MKKLTSLLFILVTSLIILTAFYHQVLNAQVFWEERNSGVTVSLNSVSDINAYNAWICGDNGTVLRTADCGYNWHNVSGNGIPSNVELVNIYGVSSSTALTAGHSVSSTYVYRTTNSGGSWTQVFSQTNGFINAIWMTSNTAGFMQGNPVGGRWSLWKTTDGGLNWDSTDLFLPEAWSESGWQNSMWVVGSKIWFGTNGAHIYYSSNSGSDWNVQLTSPVGNIYTVWLDTVPSNLGYAGGTSLLKTTNGGVNWIVDTAAVGSGNLSGFVGNVEFYSYLWYIRSDNSIYCSYGTTSSWFLDYTAPSGNYNHISMARGTIYFGPGFMFAVRDNGGISRGNFWVEGVKLISSGVPELYRLHQNYPNPFNASTKFKFESRILPLTKKGEMRGGHVKLAVYNLLGQEIDVLINKVIQPGTYEVDWYGNSYPSGIYFYRMLVTDPNGAGLVYDEIRKMVMVK